MFHKHDWQEIARTYAPTILSQCKKCQKLRKEIYDGSKMLGIKNPKYLFNYDEFSLKEKEYFEYLQKRYVDYVIKPFLKGRPKKSIS